MVRRLPLVEFVDCIHIPLDGAVILDFFPVEIQAFQVLKIFHLSGAITISAVPFSVDEASDEALLRRFAQLDANHQHDGMTRPTSGPRQLGVH